MEALSQLDVQNPDHISVITRDGRVTISVLKDGTSVTLGFQLKNSVFNTSPLPIDTTSTRKGIPTGTKHFRYSGTTPKLNEDQVREIKLMLADDSIMNNFRCRTHAYEEIGKAYQITGCAVANIHRGIAWKHVTV